MSNDCYKRYTLRKSLERAEQLKTLNPLEPDNSDPSDSTQQSHCTRSNLNQRAPPSQGSDVYKLSCVICGHIKHQTIYDKYRISECDQTTKFLQAAVYCQDEVFVRTCDLKMSKPFLELIFIIMQVAFVDILSDMIVSSNCRKMVKKTTERCICKRLT